jgi:hypothetical protein
MARSIPSVGRTFQGIAMAPGSYDQRRPHAMKNFRPAGRQSWTCKSSIPMRSGNTKPVKLGKVPAGMNMTRTLMLLLACTVLAGPAVAQSDDAAY